MSNEYRQIFENYEIVSISDIVKTLTHADNLYHNGEESFLTDEEYDFLRKYLESMEPTNSYLIGVGSDVRGGKVKLPYPMGSLDQVQIGDIGEWVDGFNLQKETLIISDKMDGISVMLVYNDVGDLQIAYSRGNGTEGADITRHIRKIKNVPKKIQNKKLVVRAEIEISNPSFKKLTSMGILSRNKKPYKNARNMVAGIMNAKENIPIIYNYIDVLAFEIVGCFNSSKEVMFEKLQYEGFQTVEYFPILGSDLTDSYLKTIIETRKASLEYDIDGVVIDVDNLVKRQKMNPTRETLNPAYCVKYKINNEFVDAIVKNVSWTISKDGYLNPIVNIEPIDLQGVTISNATGFNAALIYNNGIGNGAIVRIVRSGDVIPYIQQVLKPSIPQMPGMIPEQIDWDWDWTYNFAGEKVDAVLKNPENNKEVLIQQILYFFSALDIPHLKEGNVRKIIEPDNNFTFALIDILSYSESNWNSKIGKNGSKIYAGLHQKLSNIPLHSLLGALPYFGRGVGSRMFKKLEKTYGTDNLINDVLSNLEKIMSVKGFERTTALKIMNGYDEFKDFCSHIPNYINISKMKISEDSPLKNMKFVFTGFRDKELKEKVENLGGDVVSSVSSKTTYVVCKNPNGSSGKLKKARESGIKIISIDDLINMISK